MTGYYRKFIRDYAKVAAPLHDLLKKDKKFQWTGESYNAFQELKLKLATTPVLRYPQFNKEFILSTNSSYFSTGYVVSQVHGGKELPVCYGGRALRNNELKWHITGKQGLVLVEGIQHLRHHLANSKFTVFTDIVLVKYLQNRTVRVASGVRAYSFRVTILRSNTDLVQKQITCPDKHTQTQPPKSPVILLIISVPSRLPRSTQRWLWFTMIRTKL